TAEVCTIINGHGFITNVTGFIQQGTNVTITGAGTTASPYVINAAGGGGGSGVTTAEVCSLIDARGFITSADASVMASVRAEAVVNSKSFLTSAITTAQVCTIVESKGFL